MLQFFAPSSLMQHALQAEETIYIEGGSIHSPTVAKEHFCNLQDGTNPLPFPINEIFGPLCITVKNILVGKVSMQYVAAARQSQDTQFTFAYYKGNRP